MATSPNKRSRTLSNVATPTSNRTRAEIIVVGSTPTRKPRGGASGAPRGRPPRTPRSAAAATTVIPPISPSKGKKGKDKAVETPSPTKTPRNTSARRAQATREAINNPDEVTDSQDEGHEGDDIDDDDDEGSVDADETSNKPIATTLQLPDLTGDVTIKRTASDVYLYLGSKPSRTSSNTFSSLLPQLSPEEIKTLISSSPSHITQKHSSLMSTLAKMGESQYDRWMFELMQGFNILIYGFGSKMRLINNFAKQNCTKRGHVVIVNAFWSPAVTLRTVIEAIEQQVPEISQSDQDPSSSSGGGIEAQTERIYRHFTPHNHSLLSASAPHDRRLFLVIHNIDYSAPLRAPRARACLALLASNPRIHLVASMDNIHSGLMWTTGEMLSRKHEPLRAAVEQEHKGDHEQETMDEDDDLASSLPSSSKVNRIPSSRGFAWLWHEAVTFAPYDIELSFRNTSVLPRSKGSAAMSELLGGMGGAGMDGGGEPINETAAKQVLASVTQKAKRLFGLLGKAELAAYDEQGEGPIANGGASKSLGMSYDILAVRAREEFLATSDGALRALLTEFRDHGLVVQSTGGSGAGASADAGSGKVAGDILWIPLSRDVLVRLLDGLAL